nr:MAG TPA: hypothetical protein [Caudoviricetes sp.]
MLECYEDGLKSSPLPSVEGYFYSLHKLRNYLLSSETTAPLCVCRNGAQATLVAF